jgi:hypothetical protein
MSVAHIVEPGPDGGGIRFALPRVFVLSAGRRTVHPTAVAPQQEKVVMIARDRR